MHLVWNQYLLGEGMMDLSFTYNITKQSYKQPMKLQVVNNKDWINYNSLIFTPVIFKVSIDDIIYD